MKKNTNKHSPRMHVKQGNQVKIIAGAHKGKTGLIIKVITKSSQVLIEDINVKIKHKQSFQEGQIGQKIQIPFPIHSSNVILCTQTTNNE